MGYRCVKEVVIDGQVIRPGSVVELTGRYEYMGRQLVTFSYCGKRHVMRLNGFTRHFMEES